MAQNVRIIDPAAIVPHASNRDTEKTKSRSAEHERIGNHFPHRLLEELAPNGEADYILNNINNMSEEEAVSIIWESYKFHADDWNFPSDMRERACDGCLRAPRSTVSSPTAISGSMPP